MNWYKTASSLKSDKYLKKLDEVFFARKNYLYQQNDGEKASRLVSELSDSYKAARRFFESVPDEAFDNSSGKWKNEGVAAVKWGEGKGLFGNKMHGYFASEVARMVSDAPVVAESGKQKLVKHLMKLKGNQGGDAVWDKRWEGAKSLVEMAPEQMFKGDRTWDGFEVVKWGLQNGVITQEEGRWIEAVLTSEV